MKKITIVFILLILSISCNTKNETLHFATFSGKISNPQGDELVLTNKNDKTYKKIFKLDSLGKFKDTIKVGQSYNYSFQHGEFGSLYFKNGMNVYMTLDPNKFDESIKFSGNGSKYSSFLAALVLEKEKIITTYNLELTDSDSLIDSKLFKSKNLFKKFIKSYKGSINDSLLERKTEDFIKSLPDVKKRHISLRNDQIELKNMIGKKSPIFYNYSNFDGSTSSLDDFRGKYLFIDLWATWCGPCKNEIPFLKELENEFHDKKIQFVSISIDFKRDFEKWKRFVKREKLGGVQLFADNGFDSKFLKQYKVQGIPRFILIDPNGFVIDPNAVKPSLEVEIRDLLSSLF